MLKFYCILILEILLSPILYLIEELKKAGYLPVNPGANLRTKRKKANANKLLVCIHDWAGYNITREKSFKNGKKIKCGLKYQIERFANYKGTKTVDYLLTISGIDDTNTKKYQGLKFKSVSNIGLDFSGYSYFAENLPEENCYVLLMNTSVESSQDDFIDDYISFMESNPSIGLLGISYSTKMYQTIIKNNFNPHIQSFFLMTTSDILKQINKYNNGFPGEKIDYKRLLIREGEIGISKIIERLGYSLCVIDEHGKPFILPTSQKKFFNSNKLWPMPYGDYRYAVKTPNKINKMTC